jgi:hypothetical protein
MAFAVGCPRELSTARPLPAVCSSSPNASSARPSAGVGPVPCRVQAREPRSQGRSSARNIRTGFVKPHFQDYCANQLQQAEDQIEIIDLLAVSRQGFGNRVHAIELIEIFIPPECRPRLRIRHAQTLLPVADRVSGPLGRSRAEVDGRLARAETPSYRGTSSIRALMTRLPLHTHLPPFSSPRRARP